MVRRTVAQLEQELAETRGQFMEFAGLVLAGVSRLPSGCNAHYYATDIVLDALAQVGVEWVGADEEEE